MIETGQTFHGRSKLSIQSNSYEVRCTRVDTRLVRATGMWRGECQWPVESYQRASVNFKNGRRTIRYLVRIAGKWRNRRKALEAAVKQKRKHR